MAKNFHQETAAECLRNLGLDLGDDAAGMERNDFIRRLHNVSKRELQRIAGGGAGDKGNPVDASYSGDEDGERSLSTVLELAPKNRGIGMRVDEMAGWLKERAKKVSAA